MNIQELQKLKTLHHAYIVSGSAEQGKVEVLAMLEARGIETKGSPDVMVLSFPELLVDDVRERLLPFAALKPIRERKYLIVSFARANDASQNALLKAVEESLGNTVFFFCVDALGHVLPTLRSRCIILNTEHRALSTQTDDAKEFLKETFDMRLARVEKMVSYVSKNQDRIPVRAFVKELIFLGEKKFNPQTLRDLLDAERYLRLQGSSVKSILGHLAVSLPQLH